MSHKVEQLRIDLRAVFYKEGDVWVAHCLEMDVMGHGTDRMTAFKKMDEAVHKQVEMSIRFSNRANIFQPADARFFEMYAAGSDTAKGTCVIQKTQKKTKADFEIGPIETREYQGQLAAC